MVRLGVFGEFFCLGIVSEVGIFESFFVRGFCL